MDARKLIYLASVVEHGSFKRAARHLDMSQPALSTSVARLEDSVGGKLLDRGPAGVTPTALGQLVYAHACVIRDEIDLAAKRIRVSELAVSGPITLGALPSLAAHILPAAVCKWRERHRTSSLRLYIMNQLELTPSLIRGELDFIIGMTDFYGDVEGLRQRVLFRDRLSIIARPSHPAFHIPNVSWARLMQFPWILFGRHRSLLEVLLRPEGASLPQQLTECGSVDFIKSLVAESDSLAFLPHHAVAADVVAGRLRPLDFGATELGRDIAVVFREQSPLRTASRELIDEIEAAGLALSRNHHDPAPIDNSERSMLRVRLGQRHCPHSAV